MGPRDEWEQQFSRAGRRRYASVRRPERGMSSGTQPSEIKSINDPSDIGSSRAITGLELGFFFMAFKGVLYSRRRSSLRAVQPWGNFPL